ncbi:MAG: VTT domain-containing protein [Opitutaceae bacterium]|nr:VTT domain-containing protein [Opitutaceae bacterium]
MAFRIPRLKVWQWLVLAVLALGAAAAGWFVLRRVDWVAVLAPIKDRPVLFFSALAVLPAVGAPMSPFYVAAGATYPLSIAIGGTVLAMSANIALSYLLARGVLHPVVERLARRFGYAIPQIPEKHRWMATLLIRITPGPPFCMQHYLLALGRVPFGIYLAVSVPVCGLMASAFVAASAGAKSSLATGSLTQVIVGVIVLVAIVVGIRALRRHLQRRAHMKVSEHGEIEADDSRDDLDDKHNPPKA